MIVINNNDQEGGNSANALVINQYLSEKLVEQFEKRIEDLQSHIVSLTAKT